MKQTNEKVYRCDFCNKAIISAGSMKLHERMCKKNPNNKHKCFQYCKNLILEDGERRTSEYGEEYIIEKSFLCEKTGKELYSYKLERYKTNAKRIEKLTRMPLECEFYEAKQGHDFSEPMND